MTTPKLITAEEARELMAMHERINNALETVDERIRAAASEERSYLILDFLCTASGLSPVGKIVVDRLLENDFVVTETYEFDQSNPGEVKISWEPQP